MEENKNKTKYIQCLNKLNKIPANAQSSFWSVVAFLSQTEIKGSICMIKKCTRQT